MSEIENTPEDVEGHRYRVDGSEDIEAAKADDVEGHRYKVDGSEESDEDDVEGHRYKL